MKHMSTGRQDRWSGGNRGGRFEARVETDWQGCKSNMTSTKWESAEDENDI